MSVVPTSTLPKCTRTAVIDLLFMRKHALNQTQMLVMYHLLMLKNWAKKTDDEFYIILSSKIESDLKLHPKTVEATLTQLKKLNLIETKRCKVVEWNPNKTYRGIAITELGKEYNLSHYRENEYQLARELEKENETYRVENDAIESRNMKLEAKNSDLELQNRILKEHLKADQELNRASIEALKEKKELEERCLKLELENKKLKAQIEIIEPKKETSKEKNLEDFRKKIVREYAQSGKPICNAVQNSDRWAIDTKFYINSYSRLSTYLPNGESTQIADPKQIDNFWNWLFYHQHRVGTLLDEEREADISVLLAFLGSSIILNDKLYKIENLKPVVGGVKVFLSNDNGELMEIGNGYGSKIIDVDKCREWFEICTMSQ